VAYDRKYQMGDNGPLSPTVRKRIETAKNRLNLTLNEVGGFLGFSGAFVSAILRDDDPARVRSKHVERIVRALEALEARAGIANTAPPSGGSAGATQAASLDDLVRLAHQLGFSVEFKPLKN
jgi:hypothetical protein